MSAPGPFGGEVRHTYGLPAGTVRGFMSVLICSFFWIVLLLPEAKAFTAPLGHFVLFFLVFSAFVSHPSRTEEAPLLPWLMRVIFVGGSIAVLVYVGINYPERITQRLTPNKDEIASWPLLVGMMIGGFALGLIIRVILGHQGNLFQTIRGWLGIIAMLLLVSETVFQFIIRPSMDTPPSPEALKVWEAIIIGFVSAYFGTRA
ncbi:MAG TPA: hypothetical protein VKE74_02975 [Gemmataceae bacterium]|nr:hypothetical protein [Gemmataceae bacterium]